MWKSSRSKIFTAPKLGERKTISNNDGHYYHALHWTDHLNVGTQMTVKKCLWYERIVPIVLPREGKRALRYLAKQAIFFMPQFGTEHVAHPQRRSKNIGG